MRIAIMGSGAIGGYFGARLAQTGQDLTFMARGAHLEAIRSHGLQHVKILRHLLHMPESGLNFCQNHNFLSGSGGFYARMERIFVKLFSDGFWTVFVFLR